MLIYLSYTSEIFFYQKHQENIVISLYHKDTIKKEQNTISDIIV
jgi:hypothetical protein